MILPPRARAHSHELKDFRAGDGRWTEVRCSIRHMKEVGDSCGVMLEIAPRELYSLGEHENRHCGELLQGLGSVHRGGVLQRRLRIDVGDTRRLSPHDPAVGRDGGRAAGRVVVADRRF